MKRLLALLVAAVMVGGAFLVRAERDDADGGSGRRAGGEDRALVCPPELRDACAPVADLTGFELQIADPGDVADALVAQQGARGDADGDVWVTSSAWVSLVDAERGRADLEGAFGEPQVIVRSRVVVAVWEDRAAELARRCGRPTDWRCLAEQAGQVLTRGDEVRSGSPDIDALGGLEVAANQAAGLVGRPDFASNDFDGDFRRLADRLVEGTATSPLSTMRSRGPGEVTAVGTYRATARSTASNFGTITVVEPAPATTVDLLAVRIGGDPVPAVISDGLRPVLVDAGWSAPDDPALPAGSGLPNGGVLAAIRTLWT